MVSYLKEQQEGHLVKEMALQLHSSKRTLGHILRSLPRSCKGLISVESKLPQYICRRAPLCIQALGGPHQQELAATSESLTSPASHVLGWRKSSKEGSLYPPRQVRLVIKQVTFFTVFINSL